MLTSVRPGRPGRTGRPAASARRFALLLCLFAALCGSGCSTLGSSAGAAERAAQLSAAREATRGGHWKEAAGRWHEIFLLGDAHELEACAQTTRALLALGDPASAQHLAELGSRKFPDDGGLHALQAEALDAQGLRHAADTAYERSLRADPSQDKVVFALARLRFELGQFEPALSLLAPRLQSGAATAAEFSLAGQAQRALKRYPEAFVSFDRAFQLEAVPAARLVEAASMCAEESVRKQDARAAALAKQWLTRAVALDPQATQGHVYLGMLAEDEGHDGEAASCYRRAVETDPASLPALTSLALLQKRRGELQDAASMAERALALEKDADKRAVLEAIAHPTPAPPPPEPTDK